MLSAYYELTTFCPADCSVCHIPVEQRHISPVTRDFSEIAVDFPLLRNMRIETIVLSGGEPSTQFALPEIAQYATRYFEKVAVISNGVNFDVLQRTLEYAAVWFSLDYHGEKQDEQRKIKGLWRNYMKLASQVNVRSTLMKDNIEDLKKLIKHAHDNKRQITIVPYRGTAEAYMPTRKHMAALLSFISSNNYEQTVVIDDPSIRYFIAKHIHQPFTACNACEGVIRVNVHGQITPCPFLDAIICDLHDLEAKQKIQQHRKTILETFTGKCQTCSSKQTCGGCRASLNKHCVTP